VCRHGLQITQHVFNGMSKHYAAARSSSTRTIWLPSELYARCLPSAHPELMALVSRSAAAFSRHIILPSHLCVTPHQEKVEPFVNREVQPGSGLRLCVKDEVLHACVLATRGELASSLVIVATIPACSLLRYQAPQQEASCCGA
jgi:hypothetical protein